MSILGSIMVPHPPIILPEVGRGEEAAIEETSKAYHEAAKFVADLKPDTLVISSPHSIMYGDYFHISPGKSAEGDFSMYRAGQVKIQADYDQDFVTALESLAESQDFPAGTIGERNKALDHGTMIPLYFIRQYLSDFKVVRIGLSGLSLADHYRLGQMVAQVSRELGRRTVFVGSGDLSHKMKAEGPYGFAKEGPEYDSRIMDVMGRGAFGELLAFDESFCEKAAECGHRSFVILAGTLDGKALEISPATHQATFGVGYGVCTYKVKGEDEGRHFLAVWERGQKERLSQIKNSEDAYVRLARASLESWVLDRKKLPLPEGLPKEMLSERAGAFVSLHKHGELRGCIGTIGPTMESVAAEIIENAISASTRDPRFSPVRGEELADIEISVDVLGETEQISGPEMLDEKKYGVIVEKGSKRGLLLPNLDGVDSVEEQIAIAKRKAAIPEKAEVTLYRFQVIRHV
ncbi:MAG: AmmeMemoRadiSam system protein A [Lachnospiraceae bacterium]|nr:AmmeMemoRadiSam system protein A [Lachnospiraceae bacterium]